MKRTTKYSAIEKVIYEFNEYDIKLALQQMNKIDNYKSGRRLNFEMYADANDNYCARIEIVYEKETPSTETQEEA